MILGQVVFAQGTCQPGYAVKRFPDWTSIYIAVPDIPSSVLRGIARYADVHLYSDRGDVLYAAENLLSVHTISGGKRTFALPSEKEIIVDLFENKMIARDTRKFRVNLPPASTALYYMGKRNLLKSHKQSLEE